MTSDETLRVALVCTLPLLHFSPSLVAVVHLGPSSLSNDVRSLNSSSSAPAFRRAGSLACRLVGSELPCESHRFRSSHKSMSRLSLFGFQWALGDSRSVRNPLGLFRKLSLLKRRILSSVARVPMMTSRRSSSHHSRASRQLNHSSVSLVISYEFHPSTPHGS